MDASEDCELPSAADLVACDEVAAFLASRRTPRTRATRKIEAVAAQLIAGAPPADRGRDLWVHGSYARGAPDVGDIDLFLRVDEEREPHEQRLDAYYRRAHPYSEVVKALGCSGSSIVNLDVEPVFAPAATPVSPERARDAVPPGCEVPAPPLFQHIVTGHPFNPQPQLVWVRGDSVADVRSRLAALPEDAAATRFERTTTVPLIDTLLPLLGVETGFLLAAQLRAGNLSAEALLLSPSEPPARSRAALVARYRQQSVRYRAAAAALAYLERAGVDIGAVRLGDGAVGGRRRKPRAEVSFNAFLIYLLASNGAVDGWRHLHVWPTPRERRWLALDLHVIHSKPIRELARYLRESRVAEERQRRVRAALGLPGPGAGRSARAV